MPRNEEQRGGVLVVAPTGKDAPLALSVLAKHGIRAQSCPNLIEVAKLFNDATDAILLAQEALVPSETLFLLDALGAQPAWSDVPLIILAGHGGGEEISRHALEVFGPAANVTLLERPLHVVTLVSTMRVALRARQRQREVRNLIEQRDNLLASISDAFSALDRDWRYTYVNDRVAEFAGIPKEKLIGQVIWDVFPKAKDSEFYERCQRAMQTREPDRFEIFYQPWGRWLETRIYPSADGIVIYRADMSGSHRQRQELQIAQERIRAAVEAADIGTFDYYPATGELRWSERCNELFGLPANSEPDYATYIEGIHPDDRHIVHKTVKRLLQPGRAQRYDIEYRIIGLTDGRERWLAEKGRVILDENGRPTRFLGTMLDITERKLADEALRAREEQLRLITDHTHPVLLAHCDAAERFLFVNQPYAARFNKSREEIIGRTIREMVGEEAYATLQEHVKKALRGERAEFEVHLNYVFGARWMHCVYVPETNDGEAPRSFVGVIQDVTERKNFELALAKAKQEAEDASHAKDQFLAMLSHELRTPLTPVLMTVMSMQRDPEIPEKMRNDLEVLRRNVELEALLIDDLLDLTRIAHGKLELHSAAVDVHALIRHAVSISQSDLNEKRIAVHEQLEAREHNSWADSARLQQVFWNIIKNAVKFTPEGGELRIHTRNDNQHHIIISFTDSGVGIAPALHARIFDAFEQGGRQVTNRHGGLGLGLAISKRVIDLHGGEISVFSEGVGRGSTFAITLQAMETSLLEEPKYPLITPVTRSSPADILLVEDHEDTARVMRRVLEQAGYRVGYAPNIAAAKELAAQRRFQIVISDLGLPDGTGIQLMQDLNATQNLAGIALSGFGMENDVTASKAAGFAEHFTKPVDWEQLRRAIERLVALQVKDEVAEVA